MAANVRAGRVGRDRPEQPVHFKRERVFGDRRREQPESDGLAHVSGWLHWRQDDLPLWLGYGRAEQRMAKPRYVDRAYWLHADRPHRDPALWERSSRYLHGDGVRY